MCLAEHPTEHHWVFSYLLCVQCIICSSMLTVGILRTYSVAQLCVQIDILLL